VKLRLEAEALGFYQYNDNDDNNNNNTTTTTTTTITTSQQDMRIHPAFMWDPASVRGVMLLKYLGGGPGNVTA